MISDLLLSKLGIYDVEPNRQSAIKRLLTSDDQAVWLLDDLGLTWASKNPPMAHSFSSLMPPMIRERGMVIENGFDIAQVPQHSISFAMLHLTKHALVRWEERCGGNLPSLREFQNAANKHAARKVIELQRPQGEFFIPVKAGALVGLHQSRPLWDQSIKEVKERTFMANYQWSKTKNRWVGEFMRQEGLSMVTTFLGWDELQQGGAYNSIDWYKVKLNIETADTELTEMIYGS